MIVCASTECFPNKPYSEAFATLLHLEYSAAEIAIHESGVNLKPSQVLSDFTKAVEIVSDCHRLTIPAFSLEFDATGDLYYEQFSACCKLAKLSKVYCLIVPAAELGTPFNEEVERLKKLVSIASLEGLQVSLKTTIGCMTQDPNTAVVLCEQAKGLGLTLDPSHYITGPHQDKSIDNVMPFVNHVQLRDSTKEEFQVRIGQGLVDYAKIIGQLEAEKYNRALSVMITPMDDIDHHGELRKLRLLLDSSL